MTAIEVINETVEFYSADVTRRAVEGRICMYEAPNGNKCAFGRCMTDDAINRHGRYTGGVYGMPDLKDILLPQYQGLPIDFWVRLQDLHDTSANWDSKGLTNKGKIVVATLTQRFAI